MVIRYIGLTKYNDIEKHININLGGNFRFSLTMNGKLEIYKEDTYVEGKYLYGNSIKEISAIVGKNGAGKTSVLRMISKVIGNKGKEYVLIEEDTDKKIYYVDTDLEIDITDTKKELFEYDYDIKMKTYETDTRKNDAVQIYFSNIFDKSCPLDDSDNLIDISTNKELRRYFNEDDFYGSTDGENSLWGNNAQISKMKTVHAFRTSEINKKIELAIYLKELELIEQKKMIFSFPEYIDIFFSENWEVRTQLLWEIQQKLSDEEKNELEFITQSLESEIRNKKDALDEFCACILQEVILKRLIEEKNSFQYIQELLFKMKSAFPVIARIMEKNKSIEDGDNNKKKRSLKKFSSKEKNFQRSNLEILPDHIERLLDHIENRDYFLEFDDIEMVEKEMIYINGLFGDMSDIETFNIIEAINDNIIMLREYYYDYEIEDIQEIVEHIVYKLEDLKSSIYYNENASNLGNISKDLEMLYDMDEVILDEDAEKLLDEDGDSLKDELKKVAELIKMLKGILEKPKTTIGTKDGNSSARVELRDRDVLEFYKKIQEAEYKTFDLIVDHDDLSSGQNAYLDMCSRVFSCNKDIKVEKAERVILLLDEGELFLHPQAQVKYIQNIIWILPWILSKKDIQIIITTNSPFLLSDIQHSNVLYLKELNQRHGLSIQDQMGKTFGTNINTLLINSFFMDEGIIGFHAKDTIDNLINQINDLDNNEYTQFDLKNMENVINIIGDWLIRKKLGQLYESKIKKKLKIDEKIAYYRQRISELEEERERVSSGFTKDNG